MSTPFDNMMKNEHDPVYARVIDQINRVAQVSRAEAFHTCLAHARCMAQMMGSTADSDAEFAECLRGVFHMLAHEGIAIRRENAEERRAKP